MKHLGDITLIDGSKIEPVDVITFGSPCQDLSIAGKRAGLAGQRSGLFMEAIRIIKQIQVATMTVPGASTLMACRSSPASVG
jgi:DNA (cytosine-5)-methyltransferase 1